MLLSMSSYSPSWSVGFTTSLSVQSLYSQKFMWISSFNSLLCSKLSDPRKFKSIECFDPEKIIKQQQQQVVNVEGEDGGVLMWCFKKYGSVRRKYKIGIHPERIPV